MSIRTKIGDVFEVPLQDGKKGYFQYFANDPSQLNSSVIRAFAARYDVSENVQLEQIVNNQVDFHAHVVLRWGIELGLWKKIGNSKTLGTIVPLFRDTEDYGKKVAISSEWYVWHIGEKFQDVGKLEGENRKADIGVIIAPHNIVDRMQTGEFHFVYPKFE